MKQVNKNGNQSGMWWGLKSKAEKTQIAQSANQARATKYAAKTSEEKQALTQVRSAAQKRSWEIKKAQVNANGKYPYIKDTEEFKKLHAKVKKTKFNYASGERNGAKTPESRAKISAHRIGVTPMWSSTMFCRPDLGGQYFRSRWEANFARILQYAGIKYVYEKTVFDVVINGIKYHYIPDFYIEDENRYVELTGWEDEFKTRKLENFHQQHPLYGFSILREKEYKQLVARYSKLLPGWEYEYQSRTARDYTLNSKRVEDTHRDDIVRSVWRHTELGRNDQVVGPQSCVTNGTQRELIKTGLINNVALYKPCDMLETPKAESTRVSENLSDYAMGNQQATCKCRESSETKSKEANVQPMV